MALLSMAGIVVFYIVLVCCLLIIPLSFPGTWGIVIAAAFYALVGNLNPPDGSEWTPLIILVLLAGLGELIELGVRVVGSRKSKVPNGAIVAAIIGGLIGAIIGVPVFLIGSLLGLLLGVFLGAFLYGFIRQNDLRQALQMAKVTTTSQVVALFAKTCIGIAMVVYLTMELF